MAVDLIFITIFGLLWGMVILCAYKVGYADGKDFWLMNEEELDDEDEKENKFSLECLNSKKEEFKHEGKEVTRLNTILYNIDKYDGTGLGQKEIPAKKT